MNQRINKLSSCQKIFEENKSRYDDALKDSGFQGRLEYLTPVDINSSLVILGIKKNVPWADAAIREMSYTRHAFLL